MKWYHYIAGFFAGAFLTNMVPHLVNGISGNAFANCFASASSTIGARINADRQNALAVGAVGTPYSLILVKGHMPVVINGNYSYDAVKQLVDQALAK